MRKQLLPLHAHSGCEHFLLRARQPLEACQEVGIQYAILCHLLIKRLPASQCRWSPLVTVPGDQA